MNIYPNNNAALFGTWILANSNIRVTPARKIQIQTIITQAQTGGYVAQLYYSEFIAYTNQWYNQYLQYITQEPAVIPTAYDVLTTAWLAALGTEPAQQTIYSVDAFFRQLRADGNLLLDYFFLFAQDNQANARVNLFSPGGFAITEYNAPTWTANEGYTGNGTNMYLSANYTDSVNGLNYTLNNAMYGLYARLNSAAGNYYEMGSYHATGGTFMGLKEIGGATDININGAADIHVSLTNVQGNMNIYRTASNVTALFQNGININNGTSASTALATYNDYILANNNAGTPTYNSINQIACAYKGSGNINPVTFNSAVNLLMTNLGAHY